MAIILRTGTKGKSVITIAQELVNKNTNLAGLTTLSLSELKKNSGIGEDKAIALLAAFEIGRRILQKFDTDERIIKAMQAHHDEYPYETVESLIVQASDAISGGRPGARRDSVENYLKRLKDLEEVAKSFKGVEKSYALQAGREIRVFVTPSEVTDLEAQKMARDIALRIEKELKYPGEIKVAVIRESRTIEFAR